MCNGQGEVIQAKLFVRTRTTCPKCRGQAVVLRPGKTIKGPCTQCSGKGRVRKTVKFRLKKIPPGIDNGGKLRLRGKGDDGPPGAPPGDAIIVIKVRPHAFFKRDGDDILCQLGIPYATACHGAEIMVPTVDEDEVPLKIPAGTPSGEVFTLRGKGAPRDGGRRGRGDQHVQVVVRVPKP